jgi:hypothetical protein
MRRISIITTVDCADYDRKLHEQADFTDVKIYFFSL